MPQKPADCSCIAAGIDEAGRGCLAGPVVAAAVIMGPVIAGVADSKIISPGRRFNLARIIKSNAISWSLGVIWPRRIERINILRATHEAMARAAMSLKLMPDLLLIDGNQSIPEDIIRDNFKQGKIPLQRTIVKGDALVPAISAASILAKTFRDRLMIHLGRRWPDYGFESHKGYGTPEHLAALRKLGPCPLHRKTFKGVVQTGQLP